jgi:hypothetical protein
LFASSITNTVLKGELFITAKPSLIDAFEQIVKDEDAIIDAGASTRMRLKRGHLRKKDFSIFYLQMAGNAIPRWRSKLLLTINQAQPDSTNSCMQLTRFFYYRKGYVSISTFISP